MKLLERCRGPLRDVKEGFAALAQVGVRTRARVEGSTAPPRRLPWAQARGDAAAEIASMNPILRVPMSFLRRLFGVASLCLSVAAAGPVLAQSVQGDPPGRVARVAETFGQVWLYSPDSGEWISAGRNRPVTEGDRLATDSGARVELNLGSTTLRLDSGTEVEVRRLDDDHFALHLYNGSATLHLRDARAAGDFEMTTAEGRLRVGRAGRYRFDRTERSSHLTVYSGQAYYEGPNSAMTVDAGQRAEFWLEPNGAPQYSIVDPLRDGFAAWNDERDRNADRVAAARFVSPEMTGAQDLERYGRWEQSPDYGPIWFPRGVVSGWAPYSSGHWAWIRPWGWTWVDDAPWGFAPFHYGRWVYVRNAWCWAPGTYVRRPVYAPALVAWVGGTRGNVSMSIGGGPAVGWFPLAPREVYVPGYRVSPRYLRDINITHVSDASRITNIANDRNPSHRDYANRKYPHALTVVPASVLTNREAIAPTAERRRDVAPAQAFAIEPTRATPQLAPPPAVAPALAQRGLESRPFRPSGDAAVGRDGRDAGRAQRIAPAPAAAFFGAAPRLPTAAGPALIAPAAAPAAVAPTTALPPPAPAARSIPPAPAQQPLPMQDGRMRRGGSEEIRAGRPAGVATAPGFNEERRGRDRRDVGMNPHPMPHPQGMPRPEPMPAIAPPLPRVALPPLPAPPQVRAAPLPSPVHSSDGPRPQGNSGEARSSEPPGRGQGGRQSWER